MTGAIVVKVRSVPTMTPEERLRVLRDAPRDCWIAVAEEEARVVAFGQSLSDVADEAERCGVHDPLMIRTPKQWSPTCFGRVFI